jgi:Tol biopolymer transport system component
MKSTRMLAAIILAVVLGASLTLAQSGYDLFQKGLVKERAEGNLQAAIQIYARIVKEFPNNRELAAKALVEMGDCYEKLGKSEAQKTYQRVLHDYADQSTEANEARARLAALDHGGTSGHEMVAQRIWADPDVDVEGGVAPSGRFLSYVDWDTGDLAVHDLVTGQNRRLTHKGSWSDSGDFAMNSVPSPDGKKIAYAWAKSYSFDLRVIGTDGSNPRVLYSNPKVGYIEPYSWSLDGKKILASFWEAKGNEAQIVEVSLADGSTRVLKVFKPRSGEGTGAMYSPDGRFVAYDIPPNENSPARDIYAVSKDGGNTTPLTQHPSDDYLLGWAADGKSVIFASDRTGSYGVWEIRVVDGKASGTPGFLKADLGRVSPMGLTKDGSLYYGIESWIRDEYVASFDFASGKLLKAPIPVSQHFTGRNTGGAWSPDGKFLAYFSRHHLLNGVAPVVPDTIVIRSVETGQEREITPKLKFMAWIIGVSWSADGRSLYVTGRTSNGLGGIFKIDARTGDATILFKSTPQLGFAHTEELAQGNMFVVHRDEVGKKIQQLVVQNLQSGRERDLFHLADHAAISGFKISPDGRQVALTTDGEPGGISTLRTIPVAGGEVHVLVQLKAPEELEPIGSLAWTPDGSYIIFGKGSTLWSRRKVEFYEISAQGGQPRDLGLSMPTVRRFHVHPDGHRLLFESDGHSAEVWVIHNILPTLKASR